MPIEHIGVEVGPGGVRLVRLAAGFGTVEFRSYEERPLGEAALPEGGAAPPGAEGLLPPESEEEKAAREEEEAEAREDEEEEGEAQHEEGEEEAPTEEKRVPPWSEAELRAQSALHGLSQEGAFTSQFSAAAVPAGAVMTRLLSFPFAGRKKIDTVLRPEIESVTPFEADHFVFDHLTVERTGPGARVLAYACEKSGVGRALTVFRNGGFEPRLLGVGAAALAALPLLVEEAEGAPAEEALAPAEAAEAPAEGEAPAPQAPKVTGARTSLEASGCVALLHLSEEETDLLLLREGAPWLLHAVPVGLAQLSGSAALDRVCGELARQLLAFEASTGEAPEKILALGAGAANASLLQTFSKRLGVPTEPGRLDAKTAGEDAAKLLETHPQAALSLGLAYFSAREKRLPLPNLRREEFTFRSRWKDLTEPLVPPALILVAALFLVLINSLLSIGTYKKQAQEAHTQLRQIYFDARGKEPPADPAAALKAEVEEKRERLEVFRKISGISILNILAELSKRLKKDVTLDFENLQIDPDRVTINGRTENYESIDKIKGYLSGSQVFAIPKDNPDEILRDAVPAPDKKIKFRLVLPLATGEEGEEGEAQPTEEAEVSPFGGASEEFAPAEEAPDETATLEAAPEAAAAPVQLPPIEAPAVSGRAAATATQEESQAGAGEETETPAPTPPAIFGMPGGRPGDQSGAQRQERQSPEERAQTLQERRKEIEERRRMMQERAKQRVKELQEQRQRQEQIELEQRQQEAGQ